jgi:hypothetical protein
MLCDERVRRWVVGVGGGELSESISVGTGEGGPGEET